jgi:hypothetical protein
MKLIMGHLKYQPQQVMDLSKTGRAWTRLEGNNAIPSTREGERVSYDLKKLG